MLLCPRGLFLSCSVFLCWDVLIENRSRHNVIQTLKLVPLLRVALACIFLKLLIIVLRWALLVRCVPLSPLAQTFWIVVLELFWSGDCVSEPKYQNLLMLELVFCLFVLFHQVIFFKRNCQRMIISRCNGRAASSIRSHTRFEWSATSTSYGQWGQHTTGKWTSMIWKWPKCLVEVTFYSVNA